MASSFSQALSQTFVNVLTSKGKVDALSQGLFSIKSYSYDWNYSQKFRREITGLHLTAYFRVKTVIRLLLNTGKVDADSKDGDGQTPLLWASQNGHEVVVKPLLDIGKINANFKDRYNRTPLYCAARNGNRAVVKLPLNISKVDTDSKDGDGQTPLLLAAKNEHDAVMRLL